MAKSLLRTLATRREPTAEIQVTFDPVEQVSHVLDGERWVPSWEAEVLQSTKKCDYETGEDQKGT